MMTMSFQSDGLWGLNCVEVSTNMDLNIPRKQAS